MRSTSRNRLLLTALLTLFLLALSTSGFAWDKQRKGFILGIGMGPGFASYSETKDSADQNLASYDGSKFSFFSDFKIGYAPSNNLMVFWLSKGAWIGVDSTSQLDEKGKPFSDITALAGVGGLGVTYFLKPQAPSLFITGGAGFSAWSLPFEGTDPWTSIGIAGAIGYEFSDNWCVEASVLWGKPKDELLDIKSSVDVFAFGLTINVIGY